MRITNSGLQSFALAGLQRNLRSVFEAQERIITGSRYARPSDDAVAHAAVMRTDGQLRALEQYQRNIAAGRSRLSSEETVLDSLTDALVRAKEVALSQIGPAADAATRRTALREIEGIRDLVIQLGNTQHNGSYLFGGAYGDAPPFGPDGVADETRPPVGPHRIEVASGQLADANHDGWEIFVETGVLDALAGLVAALDGNDADGIQAAVPALDSAFRAVQDRLGEAGARSLRLDVAESNLEALRLNLRLLRSELADVDLQEAVSELVQRQTSLEAAMLATARILNTTLTDYLR